MKCINCKNYENERCGKYLYGEKPYAPNKDAYCPRFKLKLKDTTKTERFSSMHDSGKREESNTGALTDPGSVQAAMELLSPFSIWRLSKWLGKGAEKYAPRNWEKGIPFSICYGKLKRHLTKCEMGLTDEDHLAAVGFWWHALTHYEKMIEMGILSAELDDMPKYEQRKKEKTENPGYCEICWSKINAAKPHETVKVCEDCAKKFGG